jgi:hypothetical protein
MTFSVPRVAFRCMVLTPYMLWLVGVLLVTAAIAKLYALHKAPQVAATLLGAPWQILTLAEVELATGLALLCRVFPTFTLLVARLLFFCFCEVALYLVLTSHRGCPCLGMFSLDPRWVLGIDVLILTCLLCCDPHSSHSRRGALVATLTFLLIGLPAALSLANSPNHSWPMQSRDDRAVGMFSTSFH